MALKITGDTVRISSALSSPTNCTVAFWFRRSSQDLSAAPRIGMFGSSSARILEYYSTPRLQINGTAPDNAFSVAVGDWCYLAFTKSGGTLGLYGFTDVSSETVTTIVTPVYSPTVASIIEFGDSAGVYGAGYTNGEVLDCRAWSSVLTTAQLNTEKNSSSAVITSGLILEASLESALTASTGNNFAVTVGSSYEFTANTPSSRASVGGGEASGTPLQSLHNGFGPALAARMNGVIQ